MIVIVLVVVAAALHASWNAIVKSLDDRLAVMAVLGLTSTLVCLPIALLASSPSDAALPFLIGSVVVHGVYNLLLIALYDDSDFNQVYPLARGISPPTVALFAVLVVGERLTAWQVAGLVTLSAGLLGVALRRAQSPGRGWRLGVAGPASGEAAAGRSWARGGLAPAALTGLAIASYTILDGLGVRRSGTALGYVGWLFVAEGSIVAIVWAWRRGLAPRLRGDRATLGIPTGLLGRAAIAGAISVLAYGLVLWAQTRGGLAVVASLRETSVVFGALIGATVFGERMPSKRVAASVLIAAGAVALAIA